MSNAAAHIQALLFVLGRPLSHAELKAHTGLNDDALRAALDELANLGGGLAVIDDGREVELRTAPSAAEVVERARKDEYARDIGKAGLEALAAVLYRGPLSRAEVDFIRGVNSTQTLRTLAMRGLLRRVQNPKDERSFLYEPTTELLAELGALRAADLPDFEAVRAKLIQLEGSYRAAQHTQQSESETS